MNTAALRLHVGCFDQPTEGWVNTDITPHLWIARVPGLSAFLYNRGRITRQRFEQHKRGLFRNVSYLNATAPFPYKNESVDAIFSSHMLEHLYPDQARFCLREMFRILKSNGICRLVVPDLDKIIAEYDSDHPDVCLKRIFECDSRSKNVHHWHYNAKSLTALLKDVGFKEVYQCAYREGKCPDLELLDNRPAESLFVEAVKSHSA